MTAYRTPQRPPIQVADHRGEFQRDAVYWMDPPPEIGVLISAWSNQNESGWVRKTRIAPLLFLFALLGLCSAALVYSAYTWAGIAGAAPASVLIVGFACFAYIESKQRPWCSYLGEEGFAEFKQTWRGSKADVVLFKKVAGLLYSAVEHYENGVYRHTKHQYTWLTKAGPALFKRAFQTHDKGFAAAGARFGSGGTLQTPDKDFAKATSARWYELREESALADFEKSGVIVFPTARGGHLSVRKDVVETTASGKALRLQSGDILSQKLKAGVLTLKTGSGKHRLILSEIADQPIALALTKKIAGVSLMN